MGILSELAGGAQFDTPLTDAQRIAYNAWRARLPQQLRGTEDYDLQGAFLGAAKEAQNGHLTDQWKKPNHMTFSTGSQYSNDQNPGGEWFEGRDGRWNFWASPENVRQHSGADLMRYFQEAEQGSNLILPYDYRLPRK